MRCDSLRRWVSILCLGLLCHGVPQADASESEAVSDPALAMGLNGITDWSSQHPFIDLMKTARPWVGHLRGQFGGFEPDALREGGYVDEHGWPRAIPRGVTALESFILTDQMPEAEGLAGRYVLSYEGIGRVEVTGRVSNVRYPRGQIHFDYTPGDGPVGIKVSRVDPTGSGDHIRNIRIMREEHVPLYRLGLRFNPDWLAVIRDMRVLRFMDWMGTNVSTQVGWSDRPVPEDATYSFYGGGVPVEVMVALANEVGADAWFSMPHMADDDYVRHFATYVRDHLHSDLKAYVEKSNEVWNWQFPQATWSAEQAKARWGEDVGDGWVQFYGMRAAQMMRIWTDVFGETAEERLVRVVATQTGWLGLEQGLLQAPSYLAEDDSHTPPVDAFDAYAITGYFGVEGDIDETSTRILGWLDQGEAFAVARLAEDLAQTSVADLIQRLFPYHAEVAAQNGLQLIIYEGGTHVVGFGDWTGNQRLTDFYTAFNYSDAVADLYRQVLAGWHEAGGTLFNAFVDVGTPTRWGSWGHLRHLDDVNPRWDVLMDYNATTPVTWEIRTQGSFDHGTIREAPPEGGRVEARHMRDVLIGGPGDDVLVAIGCCPRIYGGGGRNVAILPGAAADYQMMWQEDVLLIRHEGGEGRLLDIQELRFGKDDSKVELQLDVQPEVAP